MTDETLLAFGGAIKALGDGRVAGYLVRYTDATAPDLTGDYFPATGCDFDAEDGDRVTVYYGHGFDPVLKHRKLGRGTLRFDDVGVWVEAQLQMRDEYEQAIYAMAEAGKLGWSSGTLPNLVEREDEGTAKRITHWPLGKDASLTPTPAAGLVATQVLPLKAWLAGQQDAETEVSTETADAEPEPEAGEQPAVLMEAEAKTVDDIQAITDTDDAGDVPAEDAETMSEQNFEALAADIAEIKAALSKPINDDVPVAKSAPVIIKTGLGDNETKALAHWYKTGDTGAVSHMLAENGRGIEIKSNATDLNITTAADGGNAVPTGHYQGIIARRNEEMLTSRLGIMPIPGTGTTVNVPVDAGTANAFVSTAETVGYDLDGPALGQVVMTLVKYTKLVKLSEELLQDEDSQLMNFLNDYVGRALAVTHNTLLLTEAANGTKFADFANTSIAAGKMEAIVGNDTLDPYLAGGRVAWVMRNSTQWAVNSILGSARIYNGAENVPAREGGDLLGYPVYRSAAAAAIGTGNKSVFFGNWSYMGYREAPSMTVLRDPYTLAANGQIQLVYMFRAVYKVLQAGAIGYGLHA